MHIDARKIENNSIIEGDICIVGAGAAGISIALDWIDTPYKVILLEGGGFEYDEKMQDLYKGSSSGLNFPPMVGSRLHYFGGTTGHWAGMCSPFDEIDFKERDWVPNSGWPITRTEMEPFYERAQKKIQLGPYNYDVAYWQKQLPNLNALPFDNDIIWNKMWQYNQARFGTMYRDALTKANNIHLYTHANVVDLVSDANAKTVTGLTVKNYTGKTHSVRAKKYIMACGAMQNARLLLASNRIAKQGLGNDNDVVGRYFMEHIELETAEIHFAKPFATDLYQWDYGVNKPSAELAIKEAVQVKERILNGTSSFRTPKDETNEHLSERINSYKNENLNDKLLQNATTWQDALKFKDKGRLHNSYTLQVRIEQSPNPNSRVTLGAEKDAFGVPRANMNWDLTALDKRSIRTIHYIIGKQMALSGLGKVKLFDFMVDENDASFPVETHGGNHHMGTTRMSEDPKKGVVNSNCQVHGITNLFVAGSGCFPTAGAPNPTLTIVALSLRLSDFVKTTV